VRVEIIGISKQDAFVTGYTGTKGPITLKPVVGLKGEFTPATCGGSEPGYVHGHFTSDDKEFNFYFHAVQVKEIPSDVS